MKLIFATNNRHKINEVQKLLDSNFSIVSPADLGCTDDIPENEPTLEGNASEKARYIWNKFHLPCFADDTGLEVEALNGAPGVYSARYAGENKSADENNAKLIAELWGKTNRNARFRCVIALIIDGKEQLFEGIIQGEILNEWAGSEGFGYDPLFRPKGYNCSFAKMTMDEKNSISHRGIAVKKLSDYLNALRP
ncbi:MAG: non-canonical purine NTP diphosphatase [Prevotellaceae bacterium]|jgi:XTP/dITP diphosphohydrolase|nr:non-canonical purine NTP diphosphatase [Prevotellaceae bacterium]